MKWRIIKCVKKNCNCSYSLNEDEIISLYDEAGTQIDFQVLGVMNINENKYSILLPLDELKNADQKEQLSAYVLKSTYNDSDEEVYTEVVGDEFTMVVQEYKKLLMNESEKLSKNVACNCEQCFCKE